jgi:hypothetical protein
MRATGNLAGFCGAFLSVVSLSLSAEAFSYQPWIDGQARTLGILSAQVNAQTGEVTINGVDSRAPTDAFTWHWGDGAVEDGFFPMVHTYQDLERNYVLGITAHYGAGTEDTLRAGVYFVEPEISPVALPDEAAVTIPEGNIELATRMPYSLNPNLTFLEDACFGAIPRETLEYLMTVAATVQLGFVAWDVYLPDGSFHQVLLQDPDLSGGMYSLWFTTPVSFAAPCAAVSGTAELPSMFHEMGHNVTLNFPAGYHYGGKIDGDANAIYSETMAQIFAHAALYEIVNASDAYGLPAELIADLEEQAIGSFGIVKDWYQQYVDGGASYSSWNEPATDEDETLGTFMTIAYKFIEHAEEQSQGFSAPVGRLSAFFGRFNEDWHDRYSPDVNSPEAESFRATLWVAALSDAFESDLRQEFRALNFPVDDAVFDELSCEDCGYAGAGGGGGAAGATAPGGGAAGSPQHGAAGGEGGAAGRAGPSVAGSSGAGSPQHGTAGGEGGATGGATPSAAGGEGAASSQYPADTAGASGSSLEPGHAGAAGASPASTEEAGGYSNAAPDTAAAAAAVTQRSNAGAAGAAAATPGAALAQDDGCQCGTPGSGSSRTVPTFFAYLVAAAGLAFRARLRRAPRNRRCATRGW